MSPESDAWLAKPATMKAMASADQPKNGTGLKPVEGVAKVGDDVVCILTPYGDPEEPRRDAGGRELFLRELAVARRCGMRDDRVDAAEARRTCAELEVVHERLSYGAAPAELDGEHPTRAGQLAPGELVLWIALESGVVDALDALVGFEEARDREAV